MRSALYGYTLHKVQTKRISLQDAGGSHKGDLKSKDWGDEVTRRGQVTAALSTMVVMYGLRKWSTLTWAIMRVLSPLITLKLKKALNQITRR